MADALDEEWWLQSDPKGADPDTSKNKKGGSAGGKNVSSATIKASKSKKRKVQDEEVTKTVEPGEQKKKKRRKKKMSDVVAKQNLETLTNDALILSLQNQKLTPVEKDDITLDGTKHFVDCNDMNHPPSSYLKMVIPKWKRILIKTESSPGAPLLIIVASGALRVIELIRQIEEFKTPEARVMKLFAKHIKLNEQTKALETRDVHIAVGTPNRILALLDSGALKVSQLRFLILDWTWRDQKLRRQVDIPEVKKDTYQLLTKHIVPRVKDNKAKIGLL